MTTTRQKTTKKYHTWDEVRGELSPEEEAELEDLRAEAASEAVAYSLGELRQARAMTQIELADRLKRAQPTISEMENTNDHLMSTVRSVVESLGGRLEINSRVRRRADPHHRAAPPPHSGPLRTNGLKAFLEARACWKGTVTTRAITLDWGGNASARTGNMEQQDLRTDLSLPLPPLDGLSLAVGQGACHRNRSFRCCELPAGRARGPRGLHPT